MKQLFFHQLENYADKFFFELVVLGSVQSSHGVVWKRQPNHFYAIEYTEPEVKVICLFCLFELICLEKVDETCNIFLGNSILL